MSTVAAVSISGTRAVVVTGDQGPEGKIRIMGVTSVDAAQKPPAPAGDTLDAPETTDSAPTLLELNADVIVGAVGESGVLYRKSSLPFADPKRIEQVLPLQIQDVVPFDVSDFVISNVVLGKNGGNEFKILSSMIAASEVRAAIETLASLGAEPRLLTTKASSLALLPELFSGHLGTTYALLAAGSSGCSLAAFINGELQHLRDFPAGPSQDGVPRLGPVLLAAVKSSLVSLEQEFSIRLETVHFIGSREAAQECSEELRMPLRMLDLNAVVRREDGGAASDADLCWAVGLIAAENTKRKELRRRMIDFRKGPFAYQPAWGSFWAALKDELVPISLAIVFLIGWLFSLVYRTNNALQMVDGRIRQVVSEAGTDPISRGQEVSEMEDRVKRIEDQLRGIGSLSSLSPLETLRELSEVIRTDIDIEVDSLSIGHSRLIFRGSVADTPMTGTLEDALKGRKERFCEVEVTPLGQTPGGPGRTPRVNFSAEIKICE